MRIQFELTILKFKRSHRPDIAFIFNHQMSLFVTPFYRKKQQQQQCISKVSQSVPSYELKIKLIN